MVMAFFESLFNILKKTYCRVTLIIVSYGYSITISTMDDFKYKASAFGLVYFVVHSINNFIGGQNYLIEPYSVYTVIQLIL